MSKTGGMGDYLMVSFATHDGVPTYRDSEIHALYERLVSEGGHHVFRDGSVVGADEFLSMAKRVSFFVAHVRGEVAGAVWVNRIQARFGQCSFFIFRQFWGPQAAALGRHCLRELLTAQVDGRYCLDMLVGLTPADNRAAVAFALRCGWKRRAELPYGAYNYLTQENGPVVVTTATREDLQ